MMGRILIALCTCVSLAVWEFWGKGVYTYVLEQQGLTYDFAMGLIGYGIPLTAAMLLSWWIGRRG